MRTGDICHPVFLEIINVYTCYHLSIEKGGFLLSIYLKPFLHAPLIGPLCVCRYLKCEWDVLSFLMIFSVCHAGVTVQVKFTLAVKDL